MKATGRENSHIRMSNIQGVHLDMSIVLLMGVQRV